MNKRHPVLTVALIVLGLGLGGCATTAGEASNTSPTPDNSILVGITSNYPPVIFNIGGQTAGLEADFARRLGAELGRPVRFVEVGWDEQIPALLAGKTDIIMSGMTITKAREVRIAFSQPYLKSGLLVAFNTQNALKYTSLNKIREFIPAVGFVRGTTGEAYARDTFREGNRMIPVKSASEAALDLKNKRFDIFVYDAPSIVWIVSENEAQLKLLPEFLNTEYLGWGLRRDDRELLVRVNAALGKWEKDGTLKETIIKWLPYWKQF